MILFLLACRAPDATGELLLARLDTDQDGQVGAAEYTAVAEPGDKLDRWDTDQSGGLDAAELGFAFRTENPSRLQQERVRNCPPPHVDCTIKGP